MWGQKDLFGGKLPMRPNGQPPKGACDEKCFDAEEDRCTCKCGGAYHGLGRLNHRVKASIKKGARPLQISDVERIIPSEVAKAFFDKITDWKCLCEASLKDLPLCGYDHDDGWKVPGFEKLQWLWIHCVQCGYDMSIWKMGVPRDFDPTDYDVLKNLEKARAAADAEPKVGEVIKEGPYKDFTLVSKYTSEEATEDGYLFDVDLIQRQWRNCPIKYITTGLLEKGYWNDRCKNAVPRGQEGINDRCQMCDVWIKDLGNKLSCKERTLNIPNIHDLLHQVLDIFNKVQKKDWFLEGSIELPNGSKQKVFIAQNETGRYTVMLPEEY